MKLTVNHDRVGKIQTGLLLSVLPLISVSAGMYIVLTTKKNLCFQIILYHLDLGECPFEMYKNKVKERFEFNEILQKVYIFS